VALDRIGGAVPTAQEGALETLETAMRGPPGDVGIRSALVREEAGKRRRAEVPEAAPHGPVIAFVLASEGLSSNSPANAKGRPTHRLVQNGCLRRSCPCHWSKPSARTSQRYLRKAARKAGLVATVSRRA
jgi:hypothetical protein